MFAFHFCSLFSFLSLVLATPVDKGSDSAILERDVCIIGGGSSGTYAAVRLQQMGKTVALIDKESRLGGHVNTYTDSKTGQTVDYGVQIFSNLTVLHDFFTHFDIPLERMSTSAAALPSTIDFLSGSTIVGNVVDVLDIAAGLLSYVAQLTLYPGIASEWNLPASVPSDLLLPFGDFIAKYNLSAISTVAFSYNQGIGNILAQPTLYVMKYFDQQIVNDILMGSFVVNGLQNNQLLYNRAETELGSSNVFLNSTVTRVRRSANGTTIRVLTPTGFKLIRASKLLLAIPPKLSNVNFLDLTPNEQSLFAQFNNSYYWDAVVTNTGIPDSTSIANTDPDAPYGIPALPGMYGVSSTALPRTKLAYYSSPYPLSDSEVKAAILSTISRIAEAQGFDVPAGGPQIADFHNHSPFELTVSNSAISSGFYDKLQALQGQRSTWWTGAAWNKHATAQLWNFTEHVILPNLLQ